MPILSGSLEIKPNVRVVKSLNNKSMNKKKPGIEKVVKKVLSLFVFVTFSFVLANSLFASEKIEIKKNPEDKEVKKTGVFSVPAPMQQKKG